MSERADLHGKSGPGHVIEHNGKTYTLPHAFDVNDLLAFEDKLYQRANKTLSAQRDAMLPDDYRAELKAIREKYEAGGFGFESPETEAVLKTTRGALLFLNHILNVPDEELFDLLAHKSAELMEAVEAITRATFPDPPKQQGGTAGPKAQARLHRAR